MADFLAAKAIESEDEEDDITHDAKRKRTRRQRTIIVDSDEDDENDAEVDEQRLQQDLQDLINDNPSGEEDSGCESDSSPKRKKKGHKLDDQFEEDDYALIEENLGVKIKRKKFKRLRSIDDDEDEVTNNNEEHGEEADCETIANEVFTLSDSDTQDEQHEEEMDSLSLSDDSSDSDLFIVDDEGRPLIERKKKRKQKQIYNDAALQAAHEIFGGDFNFDFDEHQEEEEVEDEEDEDDSFYESGDERRRTKSKRVTKKKSIFDIYEPSELKRGHFTDLDNQIRKNDIPERMQLREVPITSVPEDSNELNEEAEWIYAQAFCKPTITTQLFYQGSIEGEPIVKIKNALDLMRNQHFEVPFITLYRKEQVLPELSINDLWKVYQYDAKWCELKARKRTLLKQLERMRDYLLEDCHSILSDDIRLFDDDDILQLEAVQTSEELNDIRMHFLLYYGHLLPKVREKERTRALELVEQPEEKDDEIIKPAVRGGPYAIFRKAKLDGLVKSFGLKPEQFADNLKDSSQKHDIQQKQTLPYDLAEQYCGDLLSTPSEVLRAAKFMVATQLSREPLVRKVLRDVFFQRARMNVAATSKGVAEIDENHPCFGVKYLRGKPVCELEGFDFLKLHIAEKDGLLKISFDEDVEGLNSPSYLGEMKALYTKVDERSLVKEWNNLRSDCVELAYREMLWPSMVKELRIQMLAEAKECVLNLCSEKLNNWLNVAGYSIYFEEAESDENWDTSKGLRVMGLAYVNDFEQAPFACIVAPDGECIEYRKLPNLLKRRNFHLGDECVAEREDLMCDLRKFISKKKPHVICVGAESTDAQFIVADLQVIVKQLVQDEQFPFIPIEILDNDLAKIYANSIKGKNDFGDYPVMLRQAISLARRLQDPLLEFSQLCNADDEILCLRYHPLQEHVAVEDLMEVITREFVNKTNEVGVDVNRVLRNSCPGNLLQYICGLGPRKATALIKLFQQTNKRLDNRTMLVTLCRMGPIILMNCAGFIKIDTNALVDRSDDELYIEALDGSRVHPEMYDWARKMVDDALEFQTDPAQPLEQIPELPERLQELDLDAFASELERQGVGNKSITLYDIRAELSYRFVDKRAPYQPPNELELFVLLTKETPESICVGKLVQATVIGIMRRRPKPTDVEQINPQKIDETNLWQCPVCLRSDFFELAEVWNHFDNEECPGEATGVRIRLDNGLRGCIHLNNLSDNPIIHPEERVQIGQMIYCRIIKVCVERFSVEATSKSSDLCDANNEWRPPRDQYYDYDAEEQYFLAQEEKRKMKIVQAYRKRVITHPSFRNCTFTEANAILDYMDQGECIIRPSSKSADLLTISWKVTENILQHFNIIEKEKKNAFSLGRSLWIGNTEYEDLDEILTRCIYPMAAYARTLIHHIYYRDTDGGKLEKAEEIIRDEKKKNPNKIHYIFSACVDCPGKFLLSYLPRNNFGHEYVMVTPEGYRFRGGVFEKIEKLLICLKESPMERPKDQIPGPSGANIPPPVVHPSTSTACPETPSDEEAINASTSSL